MRWWDFSQPTGNNRGIFLVSKLHKFDVGRPDTERADRRMHGQAKSNGNGPQRTATARNGNGNDIDDVASIRAQEHEAMNKRSEGQKRRYARERAGRGEERDGAGGDGDEGAVEPPRPEILTSQEMRDVVRGEHNIILSAW